jgi:hypothetical protein
VPIAGVRGAEPPDRSKIERHSFKTRNEGMKMVETRELTWLKENYI